MKVGLGLHIFGPRNADTVEPLFIKRRFQSRFQCFLQLLFLKRLQRFLRHRFDFLMTKNNRIHFFLSLLFMIATGFERFEVCFDNAFAFGGEGVANCLFETFGIGRQVRGGGSD